MNHFNKNHFNKIKIDKSNKIAQRRSLGFGKDEFNFDDALVSIDIPYLEFINYFYDNKNYMFKFVREEYKKLLYGNSNLDEEYEMKLVNVEDGFNEIKIKLIYEETLGKKIYNLPLIYKLKNENNNNLQFYVKLENNIFKVCFIDLYHLAIPTKKQNTKEEYENHIKNIKNKNLGLDALKGLS